MRIGVPSQAAAGEPRVALVPDVIRRLAQHELEIVVESGAGEGSHLPDQAFADAGATIGSAADAWGSDVVAVVRAPSATDLELMDRGTVLIGFLNPLTDPDTARRLASAGVTAFAMEAIPRITRAQSMDALSSQSTVAGYRAVLLAAEELDRFMPMLTTAAGTIKPATVLVLGAGVAGLQAIATARRLGAVVTGYDVREAVREQVESLGARFLQLDVEADAEGAGGYAKELGEEEQRRQREAMAEAIGRFDAVITTALVPGRRAPILVTAAAVEKMKPGSVVVDLAASAGGNCELTEPGQTVERHGVKILGALDLAAEMPDHASQLYARNVQSLLELMVTKEGQLELNWEDEILSGACITRDGEIVHEGAKQAAGAPAA
ncbi:MAG: Re/Si-specific NAD(P)(+) transhydrogenase subunit alpha [Actinobacteria bacterium]|nr:MAG: Re/Si-specific NAD(P)(+) transhydrogenase subunit alpha [Actinomycetota bacterium]